VFISLSQELIEPRIQSGDSRDRRKIVQHYSTYWLCWTIHLFRPVSTIQLHHISEQREIQRRLSNVKILHR